MKLPPKEVLDEHFGTSKCEYVSRTVIRLDSDKSQKADMFVYFIDGKRTILTIPRGTK